RRADRAVRGHRGLADRRGERPGRRGLGARRAVRGRPDPPGRRRARPEPDRRGRGVPVPSRRPGVRAVAARPPGRPRHSYAIAASTLVRAARIAGRTAASTPTTPARTRYVAIWVHGRASSVRSEEHTPELQSRENLV